MKIKGIIEDLKYNYVKFKNKTKLKTIQAKKLKKRERKNNRKNSKNISRTFSGFVVSIVGSVHF